MVHLFTDIHCLRDCLPLRSEVYKERIEAIREFFESNEGCDLVFLKVLRSWTVFVLDTLAYARQGTLLTLGGVLICMNLT